MGVVLISKNQELTLSTLELTIIFLQCCYTLVLQRGSLDTGNAFRKLKYGSTISGSWNIANWEISKCYYEHKRSFWDGSSSHLQNNLVTNEMRRTKRHFGMKNWHSYDNKFLNLNEFLTLSSLPLIAHQPVSPVKQVQLATLQPHISPTNSPNI